MRPKKVTEIPVLVLSDGSGNVLLPPDFHGSEISLPLSHGQTDIGISGILADHLVDYMVSVGPFFSHIRQLEALRDQLYDPHALP